MGEVGSHTPRFGEKRTGGPALVVRNLTKRFDGVAAVDDVSFSVSGGAFLSLLGPSGSGKSSVLRLIAGFELLDGGSIEIGGADITALPPHRREIGVVFQSYALFPHMTVAENVAFPLRQRGVPAAERASRIAAILEAVGLPGHDDRRPATLSGGEQQRVALARALVFGPRILAMDEPLSALDRRLRERIQHEIRALQRKLGITTIYVTHDQTEAFAMSDHVAVMNDGRIEQIDTPRALYETPRTEFVARFVGDSNLFRGVPHEVHPGSDAIRLPDGTLLRFRGSSAQGGSVTLLVRPERIRISGAGEPDGNVLPGRVRDITFLGESLEYRVEAGGQEIIVREQNRAAARPVTTGMEVTLSWSITDTVLLR